MEYSPKGFFNLKNTEIGIPSFTKLSLFLLFILLNIGVFLFCDVQSFSFASWSSLKQWETLLPKTHSFDYSREKTTTVRETVEFLPLKDLRFSSTALEGNTWFMSSLNDTLEDDEVEYMYFPSEASNGRLLCVAGKDTGNGSKNSYGLAWKNSLPDNSTFLQGLTFVSDTYYGHSNLWHGFLAMSPFVRWHTVNGCERPSRWVLYHWGELRTGMSPWLQNLLTATFGEVIVEIFEHGHGPFCFEKALVIRHDLGKIGTDKRLELCELLRFKARSFCNISNSETELGAAKIAVTMLMRTGARSFQNQSAVNRIFERVCKKMEGCRIKFAYSNNLSFCEQVSLMSSTDILVSPHGAQLTNMIFMGRDSSVMEFFPKGWLKTAGPGQYVHHWLARWSGMKHRGAWRDPNGVSCPYSEGDPHCFSIYKDATIGYNETYFTEWFQSVLSDVKMNQMKGVSKSRGMKQQLKC